MKEEMLTEAILEMKKVVNAIHPLSEEEWNDFTSIWSIFSAKRKEVITCSGNREKYLYFVIEGIQRIYSIDEAGRESTLILSYPPSFSGVLDSLLLQQPSRYHFEALSSSYFIRAPYPELKKLMDEKNGISTLIRQGVSAALSGVLERLAELQSYSSEEKFRKLLQRSPHILRIIPHKYLANYLGIDPTNFSKLINTIRL